MLYQENRRLAALAQFDAEFILLSLFFSPLSFFQTKRHQQEQTQSTSVDEAFVHPKNSTHVSFLSFLPSFLLHFAFKTCTTLHFVRKLCNRTPIFLKDWCSNSWKARYLCLLLLEKKIMVCCQVLVHEKRRRKKRRERRSEMYILKRFASALQSRLEMKVRLRKTEQSEWGCRCRKEKK